MLYVTVIYTTNEAHVRNPNYKGKNYDPNYAQNKSKQLTTLTIHPITRITPHKVMYHLVNITTQDMDTTIPTNKKIQLICL